MIAPVEDEEKARSTDGPAAVPDPNWLEVGLARLLLHGVLSGKYRSWVGDLGLRGDERVLDFGSGSGAAARHLVPILEAGGGHLTCVDISPGWQRALRATVAGHDVTYALGDVRALGLPAASFDVVVVHWMFHDVPSADQRPVLAELVRLLRPGGRLAIREPSGEREGIPAARLRGLLTSAGLSELRGAEGSGLVLSAHYSGVWEKPGQQG